MELPFIIIASALMIVTAWLFNRLVGLKNRAQAAWSDIDVQLKRRHDLVDNLVETVKGYAQHERGTLEEVTRSRANAEGARTAGRPGDAGVAETDLGGRIRTLFAVVEAYPDLKASERFLDLQRALTEVEDYLARPGRVFFIVPCRNLDSLHEAIQHPFHLIARGSAGHREECLLSNQEGTGS